MARFITLDRVVRSILMEKELTVHWYLQYLCMAADCLRELSFDSLRLTHAKRVAVTKGGVIDMPCDFVDVVDCWAGERFGDMAPVEILDIDRSACKLYVRESQCRSASSDRYVMLEYIGGGEGCDAGSKVHPYAQATIEAYIDWRSSPNRANQNSPEGDKFRTAVRWLRARMSPLTIADIRRMIDRKQVIPGRYLRWDELVLDQRTNQNA